MRIRTHMGVSVDGYVAASDGRPAVLCAPGFAPRTSGGYPEFIRDCGAVVMGRTTFEPALGADRWPWPRPAGVRPHDAAASRRHAFAPRRGLRPDRARPRDAGCRLSGRRASCRRAGDDPFVRRDRRTRPARDRRAAGAARRRPAALACRRATDLAEAGVRRSFEEGSVELVYSFVA
jgi:hypothetical protein